MDAIKALEDLKVGIEAVGAQIVDAQAAVSEEKIASFDEGKAAGLAEAGAGDPALKLYNQAQYDQAIADSKAEGIAIGQTGQSDAVASAVEAKRKEIMDDWASAQVDDEAFKVKHGG